MRSLFTKQSLTVLPGQVVSGIAGRVQTLRLRQGRLWITVEGIPHDYWLSAGDTFTTLPGRLTVVEADSAASRIDVESPASWPDALKTLAGALAARFASRRTATASFKRHGTCSGNC
ncbi:MAG: DUF2917 domain-containing protein [Bacillota bacterium]